ncbi:MAG: phosphotransferase enzyme family protein [Actinomycetes bacterium]
MVALSPDASVLTDPLPLPPTGWGVPQALAALRAAQPDLPMALVGARVVAALSTVVLRVGHYAVKVYPPGTDAPHLARTAAALAGSDTTVLPVITPVTTAEGVVVVYPWRDEVAAADWRQIGSVLAAFHAEHAGAPVPDWVPLRRLEGQLAGLPSALTDPLRAARVELLAELAALSYPLGVGVIHGDLSPGNVLATADGLRLIDLDFVARGPLEYDLASAARRLRSGEIDASAYDSFCTAYGFDVRSWDGTFLLDRLAELGGLAFALWDDRRQGRTLGWLPDAVERWRDPLSEPPTGRASTAELS